VGQKILVVEDNELNLKLFCDLLRAHGYEAEPVRDGREAIERARTFSPDLVVMDIQMPHVSGLELIEQMKADDGLKRTPIMAVTAYAAKGDEERIRDAGAEGYVSKPISVIRFVEAVAGLLDAAKARASATSAEAQALEAAAGSEAIEAEVRAEAPAVEAIEAEVKAEAPAVEAAALEAAAEAEKGAESADAPVEPQDADESRHPRDSGDPASNDEDEEEGKRDPGSSPG
jgi:two-component system cell cycle response regulator DivK